MNPSPLLRHDALRPLSREHMSGLVLARNLRLAAVGTPDEARAALGRLRETWSAELSPHFDDEEELLAPFIRSEDDRRRLVGEHAELRAQAGLLLGSDHLRAPDAGRMNGFASLLEAHIRWEERSLFESIQRDAPAGALDSLLGCAADIELRRPGARPRLRLDPASPPTSS